MTRPEIPQAATQVKNLYNAALELKQQAQEVAALNNDLEETPLATANDANALVDRLTEYLSNTEYAYWYDFERSKVFGQG